uniref:Uncharacterized protein n=1 Tax=Picea sitchensis TaxID=3332 RepID=D5A8W6_PICSI|nr:unknown [Picea sitchensis]
MLFGLGGLKWRYPDSKSSNGHTKEILMNEHNICIVYLSFKHINSQWFDSECLKFH